MGKAGGAASADFPELFTEQEKCGGMTDKPSGSFDVLQRITELRMARGLSVYRLARLSGIPQSTIATWYQKNLYPPIDKIEKVCNAMDVSLADFFRTSEDYFVGSAEDALLLEKWHTLPEDERKTIEALLNLLSDKTRR